MLGMSQLSREMHFSGCYLNPDTSSWPEPKHQHKPPTLKAPGVESKQSSISCVYFPCVTSTCVANTLPAGCWGGGTRIRSGLEVFIRHQCREWAAALFGRFHFLSHNKLRLVLDHSYPLYQRRQCKSLWGFFFIFSWALKLWLNTTAGMFSGRWPAAAPANKRHYFSSIFIYSSDVQLLLTNN